MLADVDIVIVGAGPAGLYAAYYGGFRGLSVAVLDSLPEPGGQLAALYPEKMILDVAGLPSIRARDLVANLIEAAEPFKPTYLLGHRADELATEDAEHYVIRTNTGEQVRTRAILVTAGIGTFTPRPLPADTGFEGRGLRYFVPDPSALAGRDVIIVGGGDSAVDWALLLEPICPSVSLVHRRTAFRAHDATVQQLLASSVRVITPAELVEITGDDEGVSSVLVENRDTKERETLAVREIVAALGFVAELGPLASWGMQLDHRHIVVDTTMATSVPRVFAAGDIVEYPGKVRLISVGFGEAATAINNAHVAIDPSVKLFPGHSSDPGHTAG